MTTLISEGSAGLKKMLKSAINFRLDKWWLVGLLILAMLVNILGQAIHEMLIL